MSATPATTLPVCHSLETRCLLSAFAAQVNFQPAKSPTPIGYVADAGKPFADRGNGLTYGWTGCRPATVLEHHRRGADGPDERYDTFALLRPRGPGSEWDIVVPNGIYTLRLVAGDPSDAHSLYRIDVNGAPILVGRATRANRWIDATGQVTVTGGRLTVTLPRKSGPAKLDFIDLKQVVSSSPPPGGTTPPPGGTTPPPGGTTPPPGGTTQPDWSKPLVWRSLAPGPLGLAEAQAISVGGKLYMFGGYDTTTPSYLATTRSEVYDPSANAWTTIADMPQPLTHMGLASDGTSIYVAGGYVTDLKTTYQTFGTANVWRYDIAHNSWSAYVPLPAPRAAGSLVLLGRELHFFDGVDPSRTGHTDHWVLNLGAASPQWVASTPLPFTRNHMVGAVLNGKIYAIGGQPGTNDSDPSADVLVFDPATAQWSRVASLPQARSHMVVAVTGGRIIVAGGTMTGDIPIAGVIAYDPTSDSWSTLTSLPGPRLAPAGGIIGDQLIVSTGFDNGLRNDTWSATVPT